MCSSVHFGLDTLCTGREKCWKLDESHHCVDENKKKTHMHILDSRKIKMHSISDSILSVLSISMPFYQHFFVCCCLALLVTSFRVFCLVFFASGLTSPSVSLNHLLLPSLYLTRAFALVPPLLLYRSLSLSPSLTFSLPRSFLGSRSFALYLPSAKKTQNSVSH